MIATADCVAALNVIYDATTLLFIFVLLDRKENGSDSQSPLDLLRSHTLDRLHNHNYSNSRYSNTPAAGNFDRNMPGDQLIVLTSRICFDPSTSMSDV